MFLIYLKTILCKETYCSWYYWCFAPLSKVFWNSSQFVLWIIMSSHLILFDLLIIISVYARHSGLGYFILFSTVGNNVYVLWCFRFSSLLTLCITFRSNCTWSGWKFWFV